MRLSVQASLRLNHAIHQGNHRLDRPLHISPYVLRGRPFLDENRDWLPADAGSP
jgi:hypothetical protein